MLAGDMARRIAFFALGLGVLALPSPANAANGLRPRTPAVYGEVPCVASVERGQVLHIEYSVPADDTELTFDELPDSRGHQFFAFAEQRFDFQLPLWINQSDYDRAEANGDIVDFADRPILEKDASWPAGTWVRITPDDPRLPITTAQAAMGVDWDTTDTPPGTWLVAAYTWEPEQNLWSHRFGAVRIVDPADPDATGPTVFMSRVGSALADVGEPYAVPGCIEAPAGSTITASWGSIVGTAEPEWIPFVEDAPVQTGALALDFVPPAEAVGSIKIRMEITDPAGRSYVAYTPAPIGVIGAAGDGGSTGDDGPAQDEDGGGGGGCRVMGEPAPSAWSGLLLVFLAPALRQRRTSAAGW